MTKEQRERMLLPVEGQEDLDEGGRPMCRWHRDQPAPAVDYTFTPYPDKPIVPDLYASSPPELGYPRFSEFAMFRKYPGVMTFDESQAVCTVTIAISDKQGIQLGRSSSARTCRWTTRVRRIWSTRVDWYADGAATNAIRPWVTR